MFKQMDLKGKARDDTQLKTVHQNTISTLRAYDAAGSGVRKISSKSFATLLLLLTEPDYHVPGLIFPQRAEWMAKSLSGNFRRHEHENCRL